MALPLQISGASNEALPPSLRPRMLYSSPDFNHWLTTAKPGALFRDQAERLYIMTFFQHRRIIEKDIADALVYKNQFVAGKILRNQKMIRMLFSVAAIQLVLIVGLVVAVAL